MNILEQVKSISNSDGTFKVKDYRNLFSDRINWKWLNENATKSGRGEMKLNQGGSITQNVVANEKAPSITLKKQMTNFIPKRNMDFVPNKLMVDLKKIIQSNMFAPVYITGETGIGKSTSVLEIHAVLKKPIIRVSVTKRTDDEVLIGTKTLKEGNIEIVEGPVITAMRNGYTLLLEELDVASPENIMCLQTILEGKPFYFAAIDEIIEPAEGFNIIATGNTKGNGSDSGRYIGTNVLNSAFLDRFSFTFDVGFPNQKAEKDIIKKYAASINVKNDAFCENITRWAETIRAAYSENAIDEIISTRRLKQVITAYSIFKNQRRAIELCVSRFDPAIVASFITLYKKIANVNWEDEVENSITLDI